MAKMIPHVPKEYTVASKEGLIYDSFSKLPEDYFVFHSLPLMTSKEGKGIKESEVDFLIFHPQKGLLSIEAKAGRVYFEDGRWYYGNGIEMRHHGPFNQASINKHQIINILHKRGNRYNLLEKCYFIHAVCFPSVSRGQIRNANLPSNGDEKLIITYDDLNDIENAIERIFDFAVPKSFNVSVDTNATNYLIYQILCPRFDLVPSKAIDYDINTQKFNQLLREQSSILNFLEEQPLAVISGAAGTGKTMIALEKARRHAAQNENVLFLCYNRHLKEYLENNYSDLYIDFFTINSFALKITKTAADSYRLLRKRLEDMYMREEKFPYKHIIIDEGQDFSQDDMEEASIIEILHWISEQKNGSFYIFYDKNQLVQSKQMSKYIDNADTKLTLKKNCRNTINIANTSMILLGKEPYLHDNAVIGDTPGFHMADNEKESIDKLKSVLDKLFNKQISDIVILSAKSSTSSMMNNHSDDNSFSYKNKKIKWTTTRKFKGLEADAVILFDVDKYTFLKDQLVFYVGASRARLYLDIISNINDDQAVEVIKELKPDLSLRNVKKSLATIINAIINK